jgi:hypothetical protein
MQSLDPSSLHQDVVKRMSESAVRLATAWSEALRTAGAERPAETKPPAETTPSAGDKIPYHSDGMAVANLFLEMVQKASRDLPDLLKNKDDTTQRELVRKKWLQDYEDFLRQCLGLPRISETERFVRQWQDLLEQTGSVFDRGSRGEDVMGLSRALQPWLSATWAPAENPFLLGNFLPRQALAGWFPFSEWTMFPGRQEHLRRIREANDRFLATATRLHEHVMHAATVALDGVIDRIVREEHARPGSDMYELLYTTWMKQHEAVYLELFKSTEFLKTLWESVQGGREAARSLQAVAAASMPGGSESAGHAVEEDASRALQRLESRVEHLERELAAIRLRLESGGKGPVPGTSESE